MAKTKRIKHVSDLPTWFQLEKYNIAKNLDANGWYEQVCIRAHCLEYVSSEEGSARQEIAKHPEFKEALAGIREKPIYNMRVDGRLPLLFYFENIARGLKTKSPHFLPSIHTLCLLEFDFLRRDIDPKRLDYVAKWVNQFPDNDEDIFIPLYKYEPWIQEPIHNSLREDLTEQPAFSGTDPVIIDFNFPDKTLIENFKKYISVRRTELKMEHLSKPIRKCNFSEWIRYGALPYLDLKIWELETKTKIPLRVIADAIFPRGEGGEETVRKTTIPLTNVFFTKELIGQLISEAALDLAEQNSD